MARLPHHVLTFLLMVSLAAVAAAPALAQTGFVAGTVKDIDGSPIKGALVKATNAAAMPSDYTSVADQNGRWTMLGLQAGVWVFSAQAPGYDVATATARISLLRRNSGIDLALQGTPFHGALEGLDTGQLQTALTAADALMAEKKWDEAIAAYRAILARTPTLTMANLPIATACRMKMDYAGALAAYREILKTQPAHQKVLLELGRTFQQQGDVTEAAKALEQSIAVDPATAEAAEAKSLLERLGSKLVQVELMIDRRRLIVAALVGLLLAAGGVATVAATSAARSATTPKVDAMTASDARGLTAVPGIRVGHRTLTERPTGCTVVLVERGAVAGVDVRGSAPGTRETDLLNPLNLVDQVQAVVLAGGSAFGLDAASGVMRYLDERKIGFPTPYGVVPIVPAAILFDLGVGDPRVRPGPDCGYEAARTASDAPVTEGTVGAGAGATVGKLLGMDRAMKGGIGSAAITLPSGLTVAALVAVNAFGDIIDPATGLVVAGVRTPDGRGLADARVLLRSGATERGAIGANSTIGVVATNARLTKTQATKVAQMAHDGLARAIAPIHTMYDGDTLFALATGTRDQPAEVSTIGALAADVVAEAVLRAVRQATGIPGFPAARDLAGASR